MVTRVSFRPATTLLNFMKPASRFSLAQPLALSGRLHPSVAMRALSTVPRQEKADFSKKTSLSRSENIASGLAVTLMFFGYVLGVAGSQDPPAAAQGKEPKTKPDIYAALKKEIEVKRG